MSRPGRASAGFTLVEIVVAMTLLALLLAALMPALQTGMSSLTRGDQQLRALLLAQSLLARHTSEVGQEPAEADTAGRRDDLDWQLERAPYTEDAIGPIAEDAVLVPVKVSVRVSWDGGRRSVALSTLSLERAAASR